ncbi:hypothetical protein [Hydrogenimonas sp.]
MRRQGKGSPFSFTYVFASFFGAAMIAAAFAYYNYKFSQYRFIDFKEWILYTKSKIFVPEAPRYVVVMYSSHMGEPEKALREFGKRNRVLAIDLYQARRASEGNVTYLTAGTNTLLKIVHRFHVTEVPSYFTIEKQPKEGLYKQTSRIYLLEE